jgi:hypothetical protein
MLAPDPEKPGRRCRTFKDKKTGDHHYRVDADTHKKSGERLNAHAVDLWWNRTNKVVNGKPETEEFLVIRQENGRVGADVLVITHGQAYDLIDALNKAIEAR